MDTGLFEALPDALLIIDADGRIVRANANAHRLFGYAPDHLAGLAVESLMPEAVRIRHRAHRTAYAVAPRVRPMGAGGMALVGQRRNGEQFPVEIALAPLRPDGDETHFLASIRDISETLRARQALERASYDRVIAELGQDALLAKSPDAWLERVPARLAEALGPGVQVGLWQRDHDGNTSRWAASSAPAIGDVEPALIARHVAHAFRVFVHPADAIEAELIQAMSDARACATAPLPDRGESIGALVAWSSIASRFDHDAQHLLQSSATLVANALQRSDTQAQLAHAQRLDSLGQLTGGIAHDFNNLLTVMSGSLQLLASEPAGPGANALIESALRAVHRGADLTDKLLAFGRRKRLQPAPINASLLLQDIRVLLERTLGDGVRLQVNVPPDLRPAFADAAQLDAALVNLALNARDAMPDGGMITFAVDARWITAGRTPLGLAPGHYIVYTVTDTGSGMEADVAARAIEPFFTTKQARGSGLGLSTVYGFMQQSGGGMEIASTPGVGTRVSLFLPVAPAGSQARPPSTRVEAPDRPGSALVVEDDEEVRAVTCALVRSLGYSAVAVANYEAAVDRLGHDGGGFDVVFSDLMLGTGPDGVELANYIRGRWPGIGLLITSGHAQGSRADPGAFDVLAKPYDRNELAAALARVRHWASKAR